MSDAIATVDTTESAELYKAKKAKLKEQLDEAKLFEAMGSKVVKVKARAYHSIGAHADSLGLRMIGHGRILVAGENAERAFQACMGLIESHATSGKVGADEKIAHLLEVLGMFNKQILESGEAHLRADRQPVSGTPKNTLNMAFPPGKSVAVVVQGDSGQIE